MAGEAQIVRLVPILIRLIPQLIRPTFYRGSAIVANNVTPATDEDLARELQQKIRVKADPRINDNSHVVKVSDAVHCVETEFSNTTLVLEFVKAAVKNLWAGKTEIAPSQRLADKIAACIREHACRQDTPRNSHRKTTHGRPARGHGRGRKSFT
jgi:hypothetical protein